MTIKTIKQLEKEIEELRKKIGKHTVSVWKFWEGNKDRKLLENYKKLSSLRETFTQTKSICKMIEDELEHREYIEDTSVIPLLESLILKLKGEEK